MNLQLKLRGVAVVDLFASWNNAKLGSYCVWKPDSGAIWVDTFNFPWNDRFVYAFPPYCLIGQTLQEPSTEHCTGVLIFPYWPTQNWFSKLGQMLFDHPVMLSCRKKGGKLLTHAVKQMDQLPKMRLLAALVPGQVPKVHAFHEKLAQSSWPRGEKHLEDNTPRYICRWLHFCGQRHADPYKPVMGLILCFLTELFSQVWAIVVWILHEVLRHFWCRVTCLSDSYLSYGDL